MKSILYKVLGGLLLIATILSVLLLMIICAITYIPYLIYNACAEILAGGANIAVDIEKDAKMRERNK